MINLAFSCCAATRLLLASIFGLLLLGGAKAEEAHAIAMRGVPKYPAGFPHLNYVNPHAPKGGTLRRATVGTFDSLNTNIIKGQPAGGMREYVFESLLARAYDEPFTLYGLLARSIEVPEDRGFALFRIRPEAHFSDGSKVTPADVLFSFELLKTKGLPNQRTYYAKVVKAEQVGEDGVKFTFAPGDLEMPLIMGLMPVLSKKATDPETFDKTSFEKPIGSGPYVVDQVIPGQTVIFRRDPNYWGASLPYNVGQHNFDTIRYDYYRDPISMMEAFRRGLYDLHEEADPVQWAMNYEFAAVKSGEVKKISVDLAAPAAMTALVFNVRRPPFNDVRVRRALSFLFDAEWINKTLYHGLYRRTQSFFERSHLSSALRRAGEREAELLKPYAAELAPGMLEGTFRQPQTDESGANRAGRAKAIALLAEAGFRLKDGVMVSASSGTPLTFELLCKTRKQEKLMLVYASALQKAGIDANVRLVDDTQFERRIGTFDFDMIEMSWPAPSLSPGNEQAFRWSSALADQEGSFNYPGIKSPGVDAMIKAMLAAKTEEDFVAAVRALDRLLLSGYYLIPLFHTPKQWIAARAYLHAPKGATLYGARYETWWREPVRREVAQ